MSVEEDFEKLTAPTTVDSKFGKYGSQAIKKTLSEPTVHGGPAPTSSTVSRVLAHTVPKPSPRD